MMENNLLINQVQQFLHDEYVLSNLANISSLIYHNISSLNWVGFYFYLNDKLILGPFVGKVACTPLSLDHGVCAKCFNEQQVTVVNDVLNFAGHVACDSDSRSEYVAPIKKNSNVIAVLDIDSNILNRFDEDTINTLNIIADNISDYLSKYNNLYPDNPLKD